TLVDELRMVESDLADRPFHVSSLLDQENQGTKPQDEHRQLPEEEARDYRGLARDYWAHPGSRQGFISFLPSHYVILE
ncbi:hypothetical protein FRC15_003600, partial [Serendipita sp. 397]